MLAIKEVIKHVINSFAIVQQEQKHSVNVLCAPAWNNKISAWAAMAETGLFTAMI